MAVYFGTATAPVLPYICSMFTLLPLALILGVAVISPGPNNLMVMRIAAQRGAPAAFGAILVISAIGALSVLAASAGARALLPRPLLVGLVMVGSSTFLLLGVRAFLRAGKDWGRPQGASTLMLKVAMAQVVNPKTWFLVLTTASASAAAGVPAVMIALIFLAISVLGLAAWAGGGALLARAARTREPRLLFDRLSAAALIACALLLPLTLDGRNLQ